MNPFMWCWFALLCFGAIAWSWMRYKRYLHVREYGFEDRYMAQYSREDWDSCDMDLRILFPEQHASKVKTELRQRLDHYLRTNCPKDSLYFEGAEFTSQGIRYHHNPNIDPAIVSAPRQGTHFEWHHKDHVNVVWNHMQADGLRIWREVKPLFDPNPHILPFADMKAPLPILPELLSIPKTLKATTFRRNLKPSAEDELRYGFTLWDTPAVKALKSQVQGSFNLVSAAMLLDELFHRHPEARKLTVGLTVAFPFLKSKNQYGVATLQVKRSDFFELYAQIRKQVNSPLTIWGSFSSQSYLLSKCPDALFNKMVGYFRGQIDVLISNLPVGSNTIELDGTPVHIACYPKVLSVPYYFLLIGTRTQLHISHSAKFDQPDDFLDQQLILDRIETCKRS